MKKRFLTFALALVMMIAIIPSGNFSQASSTWQTAIPLSPNTNVVGNLSSSIDVKFYAVTLAQPGTFQVQFMYTEGTFRVGVYQERANGTLNELQVSSFFRANHGTRTGNNMRLPAGTYYVCVFLNLVDSFSNSDYTLRILHTPEVGDGFEREFNNTWQTAGHLRLNTDTIGNLSSSIDVDYFEVTLAEPGTFQVQFTYTEGTFSVGVYQERANGALNQLQTTSFVRANHGTRTGDNMRLPAGTYYVCVYINLSDTFSNSDYILRVLHSPETGPGPEEPPPPDTPPTSITITTTASPSNGGTATGGGTFRPDDPVTLMAMPNSGFAFDGWYENGSRVSTNAVLSFNAAVGRSLQARFTLTGSPEGPGGPEDPGGPGGPEGPGGGGNIPNPHSHWAEEELIRAFEEELVPPLLRDPNADLRNPISRVEFAGVVVLTFENLSGTKVQAPSGNPFTDTGDIYARMAYESGLMVGVSSNQFAPGTILNRETAATALTRVFKRWHFTGWSFASDSSFNLQYTRPGAFSDDASISAWARDSVYFMAANGIILGVGNNMFAPRAVTSSQQVAGYAQATREQALLIALRMVENLR